MHTDTVNAHHSLPCCRFFIWSATLWEVNLKTFLFSCCTPVRHELILYGCSCTNTWCLHFKMLNIMWSWTSLPAPDLCQTNRCQESASFRVPNHHFNKGPWKQWLTPRVVRKESISTCTFPWFDVGSTFLNVPSSEVPAPRGNCCNFLYFIL